MHLRFVVPRRRWALGAPLIVGALLLSAPTWAESCLQSAQTVNAALRTKIDVAELGAALDSLNASHNRRLPPKFVSKKEAKRRGWRPGESLWDHPGLYGKSIGGDTFRNFEGRLPDAGRRWREADLGYRGGHRGAKRLLFADDGTRAVTVDHYRTFIPVGECR